MTKVKMQKIEDPEMILVWKIRSMLISGAEKALKAS